MSDSTSTIQKTEIPVSVAMPQKFSGLQHVMDMLKDESIKFTNKPTKVSATKLRKHLMELTKQSKKLRGDILLESKEIKKSGGKIAPVAKEVVEEVTEDLVEEVVNSEKTRKKRAAKPKKEKVSK